MMRVYFRRTETHANASGAFLDCGVAAQNKTTIPSAALLATLRNALLLRVPLGTCVQKPCGGVKCK